MNITILSSFRQCAGAQIDRYFAQIDELAMVLGRRRDRLNLVLGYGDSTDGTGEYLFEASADSIGAILLDVSHGGPAFGSVEDPGRFQQLAFVANKLAGCVPSDTEATVWIESDLIWKPDTIVALIDHLADYPCMAPMVMERSTGGFYDVFCYRRHGQRFTKEPPYWVTQRSDIDGEPLRIDSAGSCVAVRATLGRQVRFPDEDVFVGWCRQIYEAGGAVFLDPRLGVEHE